MTGEITSLQALESAEAALDSTLVAREFPRLPPAQADCVYLNTGSNGRKPQSVLAAISDGWKKLNVNPTITTFLDEEPHNSARLALAALLSTAPERLILTRNSTEGLQLIMHSFLVSAGDELVTTNSEHGSVKSLARFLGETRGVVTKIADACPHKGSEALCRALLALVGEHTRLIVVSQISSYTGWKPDLKLLHEEAARLGVPVLIDGAHSLGQTIGPEVIGDTKLWVGSCHKWLGAPNGTGVAYVAPDMVQHLRPFAMGDYYYDYFEKDPADLRRFESSGTADIVRWWGLVRACELQKELGVNETVAKQLALARYVREGLGELRPQFRVPGAALDAKEACGLVTCYWPAEKLKTGDLRQSLWQNHKIWVQPDFLGIAGNGLRVACHYATGREEIDYLLEALKNYVEV